MTTLYKGQVCLLKRILIVFLFMVEPVLIHAQPAAGIDSLVHQAATQFLQDTHHIGLSIGIYDAGAEHQYYFGSVSKDEHIPPTSTTLYEIGSVTKSFTGILLAQAVVDKKINLEDDVQEYLGKRYANLAYEGVPVKIVHLANHTSGLPKNIPQTTHSLTPADMLALYQHYSETAFLKDLAAVSLRQQPGTVYAYSNADVELIGIILEQVYGMSYCDLLEKYITRPNQMPLTTLLSQPH
jgi:CubicO group peptidase (beta-lactamase class C family)